MSLVELLARAGQWYYNPKVLVRQSPGVGRMCTAPEER